MEDTGHSQKRQKVADEDPNAYAGADENSSDSETEVGSKMEINDVTFCTLVYAYGDHNSDHRNIAL